MSQVNIRNQNMQISNSSNQTKPKEGPKAVGQLLPFTSGYADQPGPIDSFVLDLSPIQRNLAFISMIQTVYVDAADQTVPLVITDLNSRQRIIVKPQTQGYYNIISPNPVKLQFDCSGGADMSVHLLNTAVPGVVWPTV